MTRKVHLVVSGLVQGVGFRMFIERSAKELHLAGWVRNLADGTVEIEAEGPESLIEELIKRAGTGPGRAQVRGIRKRELPPGAPLEGFSVIF
jgi:acylphosphatase